MSLESSLELNVVKEQAASLCSFSGGRRRVETMEPTFDRLVIRRDNARIREALECVVKFDTLPLPGVHDIRDLLRNAEKGSVLSVQDFSAELRFINGVRSAVNYDKEVAEVDHQTLKELFSSLVIHEKTEKYLRSVFNEYGEIKDNASVELKSIRSSLRRTESEIASAVAKFLSSHGTSVVDGIVTTRNGRNVVLVKASEKNMFGGMVYGDSASGAASYIEPSSFVGPNNRREQLLEQEKQEIRRILVKCSKAVQEIATEEMANLETLSILDEIFAKAQWGKHRNACVASLSEEKELLIQRARHPLIDPKCVVANDYRISDPHRILLITGPNTGGKTVSMKVIGLFVLMTYCGMPIPCDEAVIPYFDRVFADIGDDQSVVSSLSSFSAHISKQAEICREATSDSLVLLDEVGSGTDPSEGESLAIAILNDLREKKCMTVATTHYNRLKAYGKRHADILLASVQFDMEKLAPTYRYIEGLTGQSNAFEVAEKYGLPKGIVKYARFLKSQAKTQEDELIERLETQLNENLRKQQELEDTVKRVRDEEAKLKKENDSLQRKKDSILEKAQVEAREYVEQAQEEADEILKRLRTSNSGKFHEAIDARHALNEISSNGKEETSVNEHSDFEVGDAVELRSSNQVCEIIKIEKKDITILLNGRKMRVKKSQIRHSDKVLPKLQEAPMMSMKKSSIFSSMSSECNLIGLHVDEAMEKMSAYMDEAKVNGLKNFRIIHGDGSGALRKAVHAKLATDKGEKEYRLGTPGEGATGATVVTMR